MRVKAFVYSCVICGARMRDTDCEGQPVCSGTEEEPHIPIEMDGG